MTRDDSIRTIVVAGGGIVGLSAAIAFARALPGAAVTLLRMPVDPAALADRLVATLPPVARFHAAIGIDEGMLVRDGIAAHHLATRFTGWSATGNPWIHGFGRVGRQSQGVAFHQLWLRAHRAGKALPYDRYSAAATLAGADKFVHPSEDERSPLASYLYALTLDPASYRDALAARAGAAGVVTVDGDIAAVRRRDDGGIASVALGDERSLEADLFIDCSGPRAALLAALDDRVEDWGGWLPFDQVIIGRAADPQPPSPLAEITAADLGWTATQGDAALRLTSSAHGQSDGDPVRLRPGRRPRPWIANVVAVGDSAAAFDPLHGVNLHLAQSAILRALDLLPSRACHPVEVAEYNRRTGLELTRVRDFVALHYHRSGRATGPWAGAARTAPDSLKRVIEQFQVRGRIAFHEEETFSPDSWAAAMLGLGIVPDHAAATAEAADLAAVITSMAAFAEELRAIERRLPPYPAYLAKMRAAA